MTSLALASACHSPMPGPPPSVFLVTLDTTRADRLGCYGSDVHTPTLDAVAAQGVRFATAITPVPLTLPSHATILSGLPPAVHGVHDNGLYRLPDDIPTLATILKERGYDTAAFIGAAVLASRFGLARGFDRYDDDIVASIDERKQRSFVERRAEVVTRAALQWLGSGSPERPFFLWVHYFDPHAEYDPPPPFDREYADRLYEGEIAYVDHWLGELVPAVSARAGGRPVLTVVVGDHGEGLGEHGERTHGLFLYDSTLHVPLLISLPGRLPAAVVVPDLVSTEAILPTVLAVLGAPAPRAVRAESLEPLWRGRTRTAAPLIFLETLLPKNLVGWTPIEGVRTAAFKYLELPGTELYDLGSDPGETVNLAEDRREEAQVLGRRLVAHRAEIAREQPTTGPAAELDEATRERMAALGYAAVPERGGTLERTDPKDLVTLFESLDGARQLINQQRWDDAIQLLHTVLRLHPRHAGAMVLLGDAYWMRAGQGTAVGSSAVSSTGAGDETMMPLVYTEHAAADLASSERWFARALAIDPSSSEAHLGLGRLYVRRGELDRALERFRRALEIVPDYPEARTEMALVFIQRGELGQAAEEMERVATRYPEYAPVHRHLGALYGALGRPDDAQREYELAVRIEPRNAGARFLLGRLLRARGRLEEAAQSFAAALEIDPHAAYARLELGDVSYLLGDKAAARKEYETAAEAEAWAAPANVGLGILEAEEGNLDLAVQRYQRALARRPDLTLAALNLAGVYRRQGKRQLARETLSRAQVLDPQNAELRKQLAEIDREAGGTGSAGPRRAPVPRR